MSTETTAVSPADMVYYMEGSMRKHDMVSAMHGGGVGDLFMLYNAITATGESLQCPCQVCDTGCEQRKEVNRSIAGSRMDE